MFVCQYRQAEKSDDREKSDARESCRQPIREESHEDDAFSLHHVRRVLYSRCRRGLRNTLRPVVLFYRRFHNIFVVYFQGVVVFSCLNSTVNVFACLALSSRFRATLVRMIPCFSRLFSVRWRSDRKPDETSGAVTQFQIMTLSAE